MQSIEDLGDYKEPESTIYRMKDLNREKPASRPKVKRKPSVDPKRTRKLQKQARKSNR